MEENRPEIFGPEEVIVQDITALVLQYGYENPLAKTRGFYLTFNKPGLNPGEISLGVELQDWEPNRINQPLASVSVMDYSQPQEPKVHHLLEIDFEYQAWLRTINFDNEPQIIEIKPYENNTIEDKNDTRRKANEDEITLYGGYVKILKAFLDARDKLGHLLTTTDSPPELTEPV